MSCLTAGVDAPNHLLELDDAGVKILLQKKLPFVPTVDDLISLEQADLRDTGGRNSRLRLLEQAVRRAVAAGVPIVFGSGATSERIPHGKQADQFKYYAKWGMSPVQALQTAYLPATRMLNYGWENQIGAIEKGKFAEAIARSKVSCTRRRRLFCRGRRRASIRENNVHLEPHELGCELGKAIHSALAPSVFDRDITTFDPTERTQSLPERRDVLAVGRRHARAEKPDGGYPRSLLRACRKRPRRRRAAEQRDEAPALHSISSLSRSYQLAVPSRPSSCCSDRPRQFLQPCRQVRGISLRPHPVRR